MRRTLNRTLLALLLLAAPAGAQTRGRIVGVFDQATGDPVEGARVLDMATGTWALTTVTGTVSLSFADTAGTLLDVRKLGFEPIMLLVSNSPNDTVPVMIMLQRVTQLPAVVSRARTGFGPRGVADTVRKLELSGFYDRRLSTGAPLSAFVTDSLIIKRIRTLDDLVYISGRQVCQTNLYLDGMRVLYDKTLFKMISTEMVLGIELYTHAGEIPSLYNATSPRGPSSCATLIWTK